MRLLIFLRDKYCLKNYTALYLQIKRKKQLRFLGEPQSLMILIGIKIFETLI